MPMRRILLMISCLTTSGCASISPIAVSQEDTAPPRAPAPEGKRLAELVNAAFAMAKLDGTPEVSGPAAASGPSRGGGDRVRRTSGACFLTGKERREGALASDPAVRIDN